jgi:hypothetical protein
MTKKVLHLSHHYGCLKDHQYICYKLGLNLENNFSLWNTIIPKGSFHITSELADEIWKKNEKYFLGFDYIITSDTAPLSRIILQNIDKFDGKLNIWICNRFDYNMEGDNEYYNLIRKYSDDGRVNLIPYTEFERVWLSRFNIETKCETIRPIGLTIPDLLHEDEDYFIGFDGNYKFDDTEGDVLVSRYHNDNIFQDSKSLCESFGLKAGHAKYRGVEELKSLIKQYKCFLIFPDAYSKLTAFELMQLGMPVILPIEKLLLKFSQKPNYFFSTGINSQTIKYCEWYNEYFEQFAVYFEDLDGIPDAVKLLEKNRQQILDLISDCNTQHTEKTINQWMKIYDL